MVYFSEWRLVLDIKYINKKSQECINGNGAPGNNLRCQSLLLCGNSSASLIHSYDQARPSQSMKMAQNPYQKITV